MPGVQSFFRFLLIILYICIGGGGGGGEGGLQARILYNVH